MLVDSSNISNDSNSTIDYNDYQEFYTANGVRKAVFDQIIRVLACLFMVFYLLMTVQILWHWKSLENKSFYRCLISMSIPEGLGLAILWVQPGGFVSKPPNFWIVWFVIQLDWYAGVAHVFLVALNRLTAVVFFKTYDRIFQPKTDAVYLTLVWVVSIGLAVPVLFPEGRDIFEEGPDGEIYEWEIVEQYVITEITVSVGLCMISMLLYVILVANIAWRRKQMSSNGQQQKKVEWKILFQSFCITLLQLLVLLSAYSYTFFEPLSWYMFNSSISVFNYGLSPVLYLVFSSRIRQMFLAAYIPKKLRTLSLKKATVNVTESTASTVTTVKSIRVHPATELKILARQSVN